MIFDYNKNVFLFKLFQKITFENEEKEINSIDEVFSKNIIEAIQNNEYFETSKYKISISKCNLLYCVINVNNEINLEFENGNLLSTDVIKDDILMNNLKEIIKLEAITILRKLEMVLLLNEDISSLGFCFDIDIIKKITLDENKNKEYLFNYFKSIFNIIRNFSNIEIEEKSSFTFNNSYFYNYKGGRRLDTLYNFYCQWLYNLENSSEYNNKNKIPLSYKSYYENNKNVKKNLKVISMVDKEEFNQLIVNIIKSSENFSDEYKNILENCIRYNKNVDDIIPKKITNINNLFYIISLLVENKEYEKIDELLKDIDMNLKNILIIALVFSGYTSEDLGKYKEFNFSYYQSKLLVKLLNNCNHSYEEFQKNKYLWTRFYNCLSTSWLYDDNYYFKEKYKKYSKLISELKEVSKRRTFNEIFFKKRSKVIINEKSDINEYYKNNIENAIQNNSLLSSYPHPIIVKKCNLLNCIITVNGIDIEFENGNQINSNRIEDGILKDTIFSLIEKETEIIRDKLNLPLTFNENLSIFGYCMDIDFLKNIAFYDEYEIEELYNDVETFFRKFRDYNSYQQIKQKITYKDFPRERITSDMVYHHYCKWLYTLESLNGKSERISGSYLKNFEKDISFKILKTKIQDVQLKIISKGNFEEFYQVMTNLMSSPEAISKSDFDLIETFMEWEVNYFKYVPEDIPNKENLAYIMKMVIEKHKDNLPMEFLLSKFKNVNDVLRLALGISECNPVILGKKQRFKSFSNPERRLLMKLLNNCTNRYDDIMKYKTIWVRFCEKIHPNKFKNQYPDLINDLLGSYSIIRIPQNKDLKFEYRFYQSLLEIDEKLKKYKEKVIQCIEEETKNLKLCTQEYNASKKDNKDPNSNTSGRRMRRNSNEYHYVSVGGKRGRNWIIKEDKNDISNFRNCKSYQFGCENPISIEDYENILKLFGDIKYMPKNIKEYLNEYLLDLSVIVYSNILDILVNEFISNRQFIGKDNDNNYNFLRDKYQEIYDYLHKSLIELDQMFIPTLNREIVEERIKVIHSKILDVNGERHQYLHEHQTFNSKYAEFIKNNNIKEAAQLLSDKPGLYSKHLDELLTKCDQPNEVMEIFEGVVQKASVKVLLGLKSYFQKRDEAWHYRAFLIQSIQKTFSSTNKKKDPLSQDLCQRIIQFCDQALISYFKNKPKLNGVFISPELEKLLVPINLRDASQGSENYTKGSRFDLSFKNMTQEEKDRLIEFTEIQLELTKKNENNLYRDKKRLEVNLLNLEPEDPKKDRKSIENQLNEIQEKLDKAQEDIKNITKDLEEKKNYPIGQSYKNIRLFLVGKGSKFYLEVYDEDMNFKIIISTYQRKIINGDNCWNIYYGSDSKSKTCFADIDLDAVLKNHGRYIIVNVTTKMESQFGWMERKFLNSEEPYEPASIRQKININYNTDSCPFILDCKTREFIWIDHSLPYQYLYRYIRYVHEYQMIQDPENAEYYKNNEERCKEIKQLYEKFSIKNANFKQSILRYYLNPLRLSIAELLHIHVQARGGTLLENKEELKEGDTAFVPYMPFITKENVNYVACNHMDIILSEYMK